MIVCTNPTLPLHSHHLHPAGFGNYGHAGHGRAIRGGSWRAESTSGPPSGRWQEEGTLGSKPSVKEVK